jgi:hypothetical protein
MQGGRWRRPQQSAARTLGRAVGFINEEGDVVVGEAEREERAYNLGV